MYSEKYSRTVFDPTALTSITADPVAAEALAGLRRSQKTLPPKLFYDDEGCRLFQRITALPEYYLTRTECALLERIAPTIVAWIPGGASLVEYGASDESKASLLLRAQGDNQSIFATYLPVDIAADGLARIRMRLRQSMPTLEVRPIAADFSTPLTLPSQVEGRPVLGFFPGSTIGNFEPPAAIALLRQIRATLGPEARLLIGVDLRKDPRILLPAYNDAAGVTAAFNLNILVRLNREAAADFDPDHFIHRAIWNDDDSRIEMHLISTCDQTVHLAGQAIRFLAGETIHTENSYKHTLDGFTALARVAGWRSRARWTDDKERFSLHLLEVERRAL
jgi:dimethylhistidine N-methyltransferase